MVNKTNKIFVIVSISAIFVLFISLIGSRLFQKQLVDAKNLRTKYASSIKWEEIYPYDIQIALVSSEVDNRDISIGEKIANKIKNYSSVGNRTARLLYFYDDIAKAGYVITSRLTDPSIGNQYIRLKNGYWILASQKDTSDKAKEVIVPYVSLQHYLADKGIKFLYFYTPSKDCDIDNEYPDGVHSYVNENIDHNLDIMSNYGLNYVDLRKSLHNDGLNHYELFYQTDHHWTVWAGLWAASKVSREITDRFGIKMIDPITICDYTPVTYKKAEFGSYGNGVTHYVAESEDFTIYYPKCKTNYRLEIPNKEIDVKGSFEDIFIDYDGLRQDEENGGGYAYEKILYGNLPFEKITNYNNPNGPKVFMIRDSFSIVVAPYLASSCSELVMIDTRPSNGNFTGSVINCINSFEPDVVIALQDLHKLLS